MKSKPGALEYLKLCLSVKEDFTELCIKYEEELPGALINMYALSKIAMHATAEDEDAYLQYIQAGEDIANGIEKKILEMQTNTEKKNE